MDYGELHTLRTRILGVLIQDARTARSFTPAQCAAEVGVAEEDFQMWEYGLQSPTLPQLEMLAYFVGVPVSYFWNTTQITGDNRRVPADEYSGLRDRVIGTLIRLKRAELQLTPADLGAKCGLDPALIEAYELARLAVPFAELTTIASALKVSIEFFVDHSSRVGNWLDSQTMLARFEELPDEMRDWVLAPSSRPFVEIAQLLSRMSVSELRAVGEFLNSFRQLPKDQMGDLGEHILNITL
jgi:transcriptional regulator with XRE-family HTH domain